MGVKFRVREPVRATIGLATTIILGLTAGPWVGLAFAGGIIFWSFRVND